MNKNPQPHDSDTASLGSQELLGNPISQFHVWFKLALKFPESQPRAMCLATSSLEGIPSSRMVLLKDIGEKEFAFFTNLESRKAEELDVNPRASLTFFWASLSRQVHIRGKVEKLPDSVSADYFSTRARASQIGSWASRQDRKIENRAALENRYKQIEKKFQNLPVPKPAYWGGYQLIPTEMEFWQERPNRLHDRFLYRLQNNQWTTERLSP
jgi:pyridoxamine 5'-phosphate oxidase